jgi:hypothetical protein
VAQRFQRCDKIGRPINLGELSLEHGNAHVQASTDLQTFGMIVPAEPYFAATEPGDMVVMEVRPLPRAQGSGDSLEDAGARFSLRHSADAPELFRRHVTQF